MHAKTAGLLLKVAKHLFAEQGIAATTPMLFSPLGMPLMFDTALLSLTIAYPPS
jgi:hypothetical protein